MDVQTRRVLESAADFAVLWAQFRTHFQSNESRLLAELTGSWEDLRSILAVDLEDWTDRVLQFEPGSGFGEYAAVREGAGVLLHSVSDRILRRKPLRRALAALEVYDRGMEDVLRLLPEEMMLAGHGVSEVLRNQVGEVLNLRILRIRGKPRSVALRAIVSAEIGRLSSRRAAIEGRYVEAAWHAIRQARGAWEAIRWGVDSRFSGREVGEKELTDRLRRARRDCEAIEVMAGEALSERSAWTEPALTRIARRIVSALAWHRPAGVSSETGAMDRLARWTAASRTLDAESQLETSLEKCECRILGLGRRALASLGDELQAVRAELDSAIGWLQKQGEMPSPADFPQSEAELVPAASRLAELEDGMKAAMKLLPSACELLPRFRSRVHRKPRLQVLQPRETLMNGYLRAGREPLGKTFERAADQHRKLLQEIERAREVFSFARESEGAGELAREGAGDAIRNALLSLQFQRDQRTDARTADLELAPPFAGVFQENRLLLSRHRLGILAHLAQHGVRRGFLVFSAAASAALGTAWRRGRIAAEKQLTGFLVYIGWRAAARAGKLEVITRPFLPIEFTVDLKAKELPAIYRHLFRFEPIRDPRFLVGRDREMAAIAEARTLWSSKRPVAILLVGERGSGKTSLINCALKQCLGGTDVVRGEFNRRIVTAEELRRFLAGLLGTDEGPGLERELEEKRRVVILEELERCFLRQVGCFGAIRELQKLITATCSSTLWILATNEIAFQFLNASVELGRTFSHRINAGTATYENLREAILLRHNLSGLRLNYPPLPVPKNRVRRFMNQIRDDSDPERYFLELLARESGGAYRAAFDMWLGQIEGAQAGILYLKKLEVPDLSALIEGLTQDEIFALVAIQQHGGLTVEEHARVFQKDSAASRTLIDGLLAREIIEPDPGRPGFRIRPEAMRIVREALYRRNLI